MSHQKIQQEKMQAQSQANIQQQQAAAELEMQKQQTLMNLAGDQRATAQQNADLAAQGKSQALTSMIGGVGDFAGAIFGG